MIDELPGCCGIGVLFELGTPKEMLSELLECCEKEGGWDYVNKKSKPGITRPAYGLIIFSDSTVGTYGEALAKYIRNHKLGRVSKSVTAKNPNHDNKTSVHCWTWKPNWNKFFAHTKEKSKE